MKIVELEFRDWKHSVHFKRTIDAEQKRVIISVTTGEVVNVFSIACVFHNNFECCFGFNLICSVVMILSVCVFCFLRNKITQLPK